MNIIEHRTVVEVEADRRKCPRETKIANDHDPGITPSSHAPGNSRSSSIDRINVRQSIRTIINHRVKPMDAVTNGLVLGSCRWQLHRTGFGQCLILHSSSGSSRHHRRSRSRSPTSSSRRQHRHHRHDSRSPVRSTSSSKHNGSGGGHSSSTSHRPAEPTVDEDDEETTRILENIQRSMKEPANVPME